MPKRSSLLPQNLLFALSEATGPQDLALAFESVAEYLGFSDAQLATVVLDSKRAKLRLLRRSDRVMEFDRSVHLGAPGPDMWRRDPVQERLRYGPSVPFVWDHATYRAAGCLRDYERHEAKGMRTGVPLTPSMREYLEWAERGKTVRETAQILGRSCSTVNNTLAEAISRLEASNKRHAVEICRASGWL